MVESDTDAEVLPSVRRYIDRLLATVATGSPTGRPEYQAVGVPEAVAAAPFEPARRAAAENARAAREAAAAKTLKAAGLQSSTGITVGMCSMRIGE